MQPDLTWKRGTVLSMGERVPVAVGQRWGYFHAPPGADSIPLMDLTKPGDVSNILPLKVVSVSPEGEVVLRPASREVAEQMFPERETSFKGKTVKSRECPFMWVDADRAKGSKGAYQEGDLLAHEAWDVWTHMHLHRGIPNVFPMEVITEETQPTFPK